MAPSGEPRSGEHEPTDPDEAWSETLVAQFGASPGSDSRPDPIARTFEHELVRLELERALFGGERDHAGNQPAIDRYPLERKLGEGAMGAVYVGRDERLGRQVAIKLLRGATTAQARARLEREAMAMARLAHPNVVRIYEFGEVEDVPFLVMELVEGVTLRTWLDASARSLEDIIGVYIEAGKGLAAAHEKGIVHRDFKPDNVMVDRSGQVLVMDFGLAAPESFTTATGQPSELDRASTELTTTGTILGTPAYMAPEQFLGEPSDARTDQFAFCIALWEALYGHRPFSGINVAALSSAVIEGERASPRRSGVPRLIRRALERGLARDPDQRWPSMDALLDALGRAPRGNRGLIVGLALVAAGVGVTIALAADEGTSSREVAATAPLPQPEITEVEKVVVTPSGVDPVMVLAAGMRCVLPEAEGFTLPSCELTRDAAEYLASDPETALALGSMARLVPALRDGVLSGYKVFGVGPDTPWTLLGFANGDLVASINGTKPPVVEPQTWLERGALAIEVERQGERATLNVRIVDALSGPATVEQQLEGSRTRAEARAKAQEQVRGSLSCAALHAEDEAPAGRRCEIPRMVFDELLANPEILSKQARVVPAVREGATRGFKLYGIREGSIVEVAGFQNGDLITAINGHGMTGIDAAMETYVGLREDNTLEFSVEREGQPWRIELALVEVP